LWLPAVTLVLVLLVGGLSAFFGLRLESGLDDVRGQLKQLRTRQEATQTKQEEVTQRLEKLDKLGGLPDAIQAQDKKLDDVRGKLMDLDEVPASIKDQGAKLDKVHALIDKPGGPGDVKPPARPAPTPPPVDDTDVLIVVVNSKNLTITDYQDVFRKFFDGRAGEPRAQRLGFYVAAGGTLDTRVDAKTGKRAASQFFITKSSPDTTEMLDKVGPLLADELEKGRQNRCLLVASGKCKAPTARGPGWEQLAGLDVVLISHPGQGAGPEPEELRRWLELCALKGGLFCHLQATADGADPAVTRALETYLGRLTNPILKGK
jgi:hypothetical protein